MSMDSLKGLLDSLDPSALLPDLNKLFSQLAAVSQYAVMAVPVVLLVLGLCYLLLPPREANYTFGFRCWWGMGSVEVWRFTQRLAGTVWGAMGLVMGIVMFAVSRGYGKMAHEQALWSAIKAVLWQLGLVVASILAINVVLMVLFNHKGERRNRKTEPKPEAAPVEAAAELYGGDGAPEEEPAGSEPLPEQSAQVIEEEEAQELAGAPGQAAEPAGMTAELPPVTAQLPPIAGEPAATEAPAPEETLS